MLPIEKPVRGFDVKPKSGIHVICRKSHAIAGFDNGRIQPLRKTQLQRFPALKQRVATSRQDRFAYRFHFHLSNLAQSVQHLIATLAALRYLKKAPKNKTTRK
jgi:hypothetical protein